MMDMFEDEKWIDTNEAAKFLSVKPSTIREWIKKGYGIPAHKVGKFWRYKKSELNEWVNRDKLQNKSTEENKK